MFRIAHLSICLLMLLSIGLKAQDSIPKRFALSGYVSLLQSATFDSIQKNWTTGNLIHNRLNFRFYPTDNFSGALELRNRFSFGQSFSANPELSSNYTDDNGVMNLSRNIVHGNSYVLNTSVDRLWLAYEKNKWRVTLGRQRINWSQTWVWNPNDIFNAYSFFDIDYVERPGSDALRVQYYNNEVSVSEFAVKMNKEHRITAAGYYKFNRWDYDFQVLAGVLNETDYVLGAGWAGAISNVAFRGEMSYFQPVRSLQNSGVFLASVALDYTFSNSLMLMAEFLYNQNDMQGPADFLSFYNAPLTVKNLSFVKYNLLAQASYPITPLFTSTLAGMYLPDINGYYVGPSLSYSAADNVEFAFFLQSFRWSTYGQKANLNLAFLRAKVSF